MWFTRTDDSFRGWFTVTNGDGDLVSNILPTAFTASVIAHDDSTSSIFPVTQSSQKLGVYRFDITDTFLSDVGTGDYVSVIEFDSATPLARDSLGTILRVHKNDFDSLTGSIPDAVWDESNDEHLLTGTMGDSLFSASVPGEATADTDAIADAVWDEARADHITAGSMGEGMLFVSQMSSSISFLEDIEGGRWRIDTGSNEMIFFKPDGTTEIARFTLHDSDGGATTENPFERRRS